MIKFVVIILAVLACYWACGMYYPGLLSDAHKTAFVIPNVNVGMSWLMLAGMFLFYVFHRIVSGKH